MNIADALFIFGVACLTIALFESYRRFNHERNERWGQNVHKMAKYHFNFMTQRFELTKEQLEALPFRTVGRKELYKIIGSIEYNPFGVYMDKVTVKENEVGHDLQFRYIITK